MHDDECDCCEEYPGGWGRPERLRWWDVAPVALSLPVALVQAVGRWGEQVTLLLANHASARDAELERDALPAIAGVR